ncbi:hypothetical protein HDV05_006612 [Chytridiales sp. JEL 0842]|nr:hypothetical protein HDV05_006612 [Chytridiales sp. JEL 0842]
MALRLQQDALKLKERSTVLLSTAKPIAATPAEPPAAPLPPVVEALKGESEEEEEESSEEEEEMEEKKEEEVQKAAKKKRKRVSTYVSRKKPLHEVLRDLHALAGKTTPTPTPYASSSAPASSTRGNAAADDHSVDHAQEEEEEEDEEEVRDLLPVSAPLRSYLPGVPATKQSPLPPVERQQPQPQSQLPPALKEQEQPQSPPVLKELQPQLLPELQEQPPQLKEQQQGTYLSLLLNFAKTNPKPIAAVRPPFPLPRKPNGEEDVYLVNCLCGCGGQKPFNEVYPDAVIPAPPSDEDETSDSEIEQDKQEPHQRQPKRGLSPSSNSPADMKRSKPNPPVLPTPPTSATSPTLPLTTTTSQTTSPLLPSMAVIEMYTTQLSSHLLSLRASSSSSSSANTQYTQPRLPSYEELESPGTPPAQQNQSGVESPREIISRLQKSAAEALKEHQKFLRGLQQQQQQHERARWMVEQHGQRFGGSGGEE